MIKPIYQPKGRAKEYGDWALNIYTGCNHRCSYCFSPLVLKRDREQFHSVVEPRKEIVEATRAQIQKEKITGKTIHLCFSCDPYPAEIDTTPTREIIQTIKASGNHVQILTKGGSRAERDFDLLDSEDWFGVTVAGNDSAPFAPNTHEPNAAPNSERLASLMKAKSMGIKTWLSCEPVIDPEAVYSLIRIADYVDHFKIGKMNYQSSDIFWAHFGRECVRLCQLHNRDYYIKQDLANLCFAGGNELERR